MGEKLLQLDRDLFNFLNNLHTPWLDPVMYYMTSTYFWLPIHCLLLFLIYRQYGKDGLLVISCVAFSIILANSVTSDLMKPYFLRPRPSHEKDLETIIHIVNGYKGGPYGFASSHAATTFALATFFWMLFRRCYIHIGWLFLWATVVSYTRIYLGVHYPGDVFVGAMVGILSGWFGYHLFKWGMAMIDKKRGMA